jgi:hypothetical protein
MIADFFRWVADALSGGSDRPQGEDSTRVTVGPQETVHNTEGPPIHIEEPEPEPEPPKRGIPDRAFADAADRLGVTPAHVRAVDKVESRGEGFLDDGRPKILFEAHYFSRLTGHRYDQSHPDISSRRWDRSLYVGGSGEHDRLRCAMELDRAAALKSCSWGRYQIMGANWDQCGYESLQAFIDAMFRSETDHLRAFVGFVQTNRLDVALQRNDWASFARGYNGPAYRQNRYDERMRRAYEAYSAQE